MAHKYILVRSVDKTYVFENMNQDYSLEELELVFDLNLSGFSIEYSNDILINALMNEK